MVGGVLAWEACRGVSPFSGKSGCTPWNHRSYSPLWATRWCVVPLSGPQQRLHSQSVAGTSRVQLTCALPHPTGERAGPEQAPSGTEDNTETAAGAQVAPCTPALGPCALLPNLISTASAISPSPSLCLAVKRRRGRRGWGLRPAGSRSWFGSCR